jgi:hypothetical protein
MSAEDDNVRVIVRVRPLNKREKESVSARRSCSFRAFQTFPARSTHFKPFLLVPRISNLSCSFRAFQTFPARSAHFKPFKRRTFYNAHMFSSFPCRRLPLLPSLLTCVPPQGAQDYVRCVSERSVQVAAPPA